MMGQMILFHIGKVPLTDLEVMRKVVDRIVNDICSMLIIFSQSVRQSIPHANRRKETRLAKCDGTCNKSIGYRFGCQ